MTDNSKRIWMKGKSYFQLGFTGVVEKSNTLYGIQSNEDASNIASLTEIDIAGSVPIATTEIAGKVKPDGTTLSADENGVLSVKDEVTAELCPKSTMTMLLSILKDNNTITQNDYDALYADMYPSEGE